MRQDLQHCLDAITIWRSRPHGTDDTPLPRNEAVIDLCLFCDVIVQYVACFEEGIPFNLSVAEVYGSIPEALVTFEALKTMRDTWAAHRLGPNRMFITGPLVEKTTGECGGAAHIAIEFAGWHKLDGEALWNMVATASNHVELRLQDLHPKLTAEYEATPPSTLLRLPEAIHVAPGMAQLRMGRRKYGNITRTGKLPPPPKTTT